MKKTKRNLQHVHDARKPIRKAEFKAGFFKWNHVRFHEEIGEFPIAKFSYKKHLTLFLNSCWEVSTMIFIDFSDLTVATFMPKLPPKLGGGAELGSSVKRIFCVSLILRVVSHPSLVSIEVVKYCAFPPFFGVKLLHHTNLLSSNLKERVKLF